MVPEQGGNWGQSRRPWPASALLPGEGHKPAGRGRGSPSACPRAAARAAIAQEEEGQGNLTSGTPNPEWRSGDNCPLPPAAAPQLHPSPSLGSSGSTESCSAQTFSLLRVLPRPHLIPQVWRRWCWCCRWEWTTLATSSRRGRAPKAQQGLGWHVAQPRSCGNSSRVLPWCYRQLLQLLFARPSPSNWSPSSTGKMTAPALRWRAVTLTTPVLVGLRVGGGLPGLPPATAVTGSAQCPQDSMGIFRCACTQVTPALLQDWWPREKGPASPRSHGMFLRQEESPGAFGSPRAPRIARAA